MATTKEFVFQGYDGLIYGHVQVRTSQQNDKINAQNRKDGVKGRWIEKELLTETELNRRGNGLDGFKSPCVTCGK